MRVCVHSSSHNKDRTAMLWAAKRQAQGKQILEGYPQPAFDPAKVECAVHQSYLQICVAIRDDRSWYIMRGMNQKAQQSVHFTHHCCDASIMNSALLLVIPADHKSPLRAQTLPEFEYEAESPLLKLLNCPPQMPEDSSGPCDLQQNCSSVEHSLCTMSASYARPNG